MIQVCQQRKRSELHQNQGKIMFLVYQNPLDLYLEKADQ